MGVILLFLGTRKLALFGLHAFHTGSELLGEIEVAAEGGGPLFLRGCVSAGGLLSLKIIQPLHFLEGLLVLVIVGVLRA